LGRNVSGEDPQSDVHIGNSTIISRRHAKIEYDFDRRRFTIKCESKNGLKVNGISILSNHGPVTIESLDVIRIADVDLCFLLPYKTAKQNNKNRAQAQRSAKKYQEIKEKQRLEKGEEVVTSKGSVPTVPPPNTVSWFAIRHEQRDVMLDDVDEDSEDSEDDMIDADSARSQGGSDAAERQGLSKAELEVIDLNEPPSKKRKTDRKPTTIFKDDDSEDLEFELLSTKRTNASSRLQRRAVTMDGWSEERKAMWTSNQLDINPEPYYFEYNEPGEADANGQWVAREESLFWARFKEVGVTGWWGNFSMAIPGRTGRQCKEFYETLVAQGRVADDRYIVEDGKAVQVKHEASRKPYKIVASNPATAMVPRTELPPAPLDTSSVQMKAPPLSSEVPLIDGHPDDPMQLDSVTQT
jgi:hypothetical protein